MLEVSLGFKHTCQLLDNPTAVDSAPTWADVACSNHERQNKLKQHVDQVWECWIDDVELWLCAAGLCQPRRPERKSGSLPTVLPGQHRLAHQQDVSERQLRRHIRRLKEANYTANSGGAPGANLLKKFRQHDAPDDERSAVYHHQWGGALRMASARLQHHLKTLFQDMTYGYVIVSKVKQVSMYTNIHADVNDQKTQLQKWLHSVSARFFLISSDCTVGLASNIWICFRKEGYAALFSFCDCKGDNC